MTYKKQKWVEYDETLSEEENIKRGAVVTSDRMNYLEAGVWEVDDSLKTHTEDKENPHGVTKAQVGLAKVTDNEQASKVEHDMHLEDKKNPHEVTAQQVGAMTPTEVNQLIMDFLNGKSIEVTIVTDFADKVAGSFVECPHSASYSYRTGTILPPPTNGPTSGGWSESTQAQYDDLASLDNKLMTISTTNPAFNTALVSKSFNLLSVVKRAYPSLFEGLNESEQVTKLKEMIITLQPQAWAKGSGPKGNKVSFTSWDKSQKWNIPVDNITSDIKLLRHAWSGITLMDRVINDKGLLNMLLYADPSDGTTASSVSIDYTNVEITIKLRMSDFFGTANNHQNLEKRVRILENVLTELGGTV